MSLTVGSTLPPAHPHDADPPSRPAAASSQTANSKSSGSTSRSEQQAALNRLLASYKAKLGQGQSASQLASLGRQIAAAAKTLGQTVQLPKASSASAGETAAPAQADPSKVSVLA